MFYNILKIFCNILKIFCNILKILIVIDIQVVLIKI